MRKLSKLIIILSLFISSFSFTFAQENESRYEYVSGRVVSQISDENGAPMYNIDVNGKLESIYTYGHSLQKGRKVFLEKDESGEYYFVAYDRNSYIFLLIFIFAFSLLVLAGKKGLRSLLALAVSIILLFFVFVPLLLSGFDPIWLTLGFGLFVLALSIFITHGFNRQSLTSFLGSFSSIIFAALLLGLVTETASLSGFLNDDIQYLSIEVQDSINLVRLVSAGIIIGILGVLDDITITQVAVVRELSLNKEFSKYEIFKRAIRVGRDHIASLVNTLVFAYVGATLPMIMLVSIMEVPWYILISQEFIFIEILRSLVGAIALTLAVPITTWMAVYVFLKHIHKDACSLESACAHHHHHH